MEHQYKYEDSKYKNNQLHNVRRQKKKNVINNEKPIWKEKKEMVPNNEMKNLLNNLGCENNETSDKDQIKHIEMIKDRKNQLNYFKMKNSSETESESKGWKYIVSVYVLEQIFFIIRQHFVYSLCITTINTWSFSFPFSIPLFHLLSLIDASVTIHFVRIAYFFSTAFPNIKILFQPEEDSAFFRCQTYLICFWVKPRLTTLNAGGSHL